MAPAAEPSAGGEGPERAGQAALELPELVVDEHAQRLERAGRGMLAGLARAHGGPDQGGELAGAGERASAPRRDDGLRHAPRETLLSEGGDHLAYLVEARTSEPRRYGFAARRVHAHVERAVSSEAEAALRIIELRRGHAEVEEHTAARDRKSTRLNSSHLVISYAVFCLKKKTTNPTDFIYMERLASTSQPHHSTLST